MFSWSSPRRCRWSNRRAPITPIFQSEAIIQLGATYLTVEVPPLLSKRKFELQVIKMHLSRPWRCQTTSQSTYRTSPPKDEKMKRLRKKLSNLIQLTWGRLWARNRRKRVVSILLNSPVAVKALIVRRNISLLFRAKNRVRSSKIKEMRSNLKTTMNKYHSKNFSSWSRDGITRSCRILTSSSKGNSSTKLRSCLQIYALSSNTLARNTKIVPNLKTTNWSSISRS